MLLGVYIKFYILHKFMNMNVLLLTSIYNMLLKFTLFFIFYYVRSWLNSSCIKDKILFKQTKLLNKFSLFVYIFIYYYY